MTATTLRQLYPELLQRYPGGMTPRKVLSTVAKIIQVLIRKAADPTAILHLYGAEYDTLAL